VSYKAIDYIICQLGFYRAIQIKLSIPAANLNATCGKERNVIGDPIMLGLECKNHQLTKPYIFFFFNKKKSKKSLIHSLWSLLYSLYIPVSGSHGSRHSIDPSSTSQNPPTNPDPSSFDIAPHLHNVFTTQAKQTRREESQVRDSPSQHQRPTGLCFDRLSPLEHTLLQQRSCLSGGRTEKVQAYRTTPSACFIFG
jgi:hypothetical protein